ncbi:MAG: HYR domain-containing protein [Saprospiraceae bacterium]
MTTLKHSLLFALILLCSTSLLATHIVGGGITYECLGDAGNGNMRYRFTMKVYRDCLNGQAQFDNPAHIGIYRGTFQNNVYIDDFDIALGGIAVVGINEPDCINNLPNICLQEATYTWERVLPVSPQSYFVEYQRCCRTNAIANIIAPEDAGATYFAELTPEAQQSCNSSPVFNNFPPVVICNNYPLEVDYSVTDPDGDQLVYSFCAPYSGGGQGGPGNCNSPAPNPPCPPPFDEVVFIAPLYSASQPLGGNPVITINPQTGFISGTPTMNGQFVVGVCVEEYRNGVLLSVTRRDFQFNVTPCAPQVTALVGYDELAGLQHYVIKSCDGNKTITIDNQSLPVANIDDFLWTFDLGGGNVIQNSTDFDLTIDFPDFGTYDGTLILNNGLDCGDTAFIQVQIIPPVQLGLGSDIKICKDSTIILDAGSGFASYDWHDGSDNQTFTANTSGTYFVAATDACGNVQHDTIDVIISPSPDIILADDSVCPGNSITLDVPGFSQYDWSPSAGLSCNNCQTVTVQPAASTVYTLVATNQDGCTKEGSFELTVLPTPMATYTIQFYPNETVTLGGQTYNQPGTVVLDVASTTGGCDSVNTYVLELIPTTLTMQCPADITVAMPNNASAVAVNYTAPTTATNCPGTAPTIDLSSGLASGSMFPAGLSTVCYEASSTCGDQADCCFTVMVSTLDLQCPQAIVVQLPVAAVTIPVDYADPTSMTNCPDQTVSLNLIEGLPSGGDFPLGFNKVCYEATTSCGNLDTCCFNVWVQDPPNHCDIKTLGCMRYELLDIRLDSINQPRYRIRATNFCTSEMVYVAIQLPNGVVGVTPLEGSIYTAPNTGNQYDVRNPNFSPFYSTRYKTRGVGLSNGLADVFEYRLPQQSLPTYIHITARLRNGLAYEAHLNTFYCPVQPWDGSHENLQEGGDNRGEFTESVLSEMSKPVLDLRPNPSSGTLYVDFSPWYGQSVQAQVLNAQGQIVLTRQFDVENEWQEFDLDARLNNGLYYLLVQPSQSERVAGKFMLQR